MKYLTHITTIGRETTFKAIESNRKELPLGSKIILWVNLITGFNTSIIPKLRPLVDDVVVSTINYCDYSCVIDMMYLDYDIMLYQSDDCVFLPGGIKQAMRIFEGNPRVGAVGSLTQKEGMKENIYIDDPEVLPDLGVFFNHEAINEVGGQRPIFPAYGYSFQEMLIRMMMHQWHMVSIKDNYAEHAGDAHYGSNRLGTHNKIWARNKEVFDSLKKTHFPVEGWWQK